MNNEETRILNPQQNEEPKQNEVKAPESANKGGFGKKAAAATGIAVGAAATAAAEHAYAHLNGEYVSPEAEEAQDETQPEVEATAQQEPAPEPVSEPTPEEGRTVRASDSARRYGNSFPNSSSNTCLRFFSAAGIEAKKCSLRSKYPR